MDDYFKYLKDYTNQDVEEKFSFFKFSLFDSMKSAHDFCNEMVKKIQSDKIHIQTLKKKIKKLEEKIEMLEEEAYISKIDL